MDQFCSYVATKKGNFQSQLENEQIDRVISKAKQICSLKGRVLFNDKTKMIVKIGCPQSK
jgi:hypothetical protein